MNETVVILPTYNEAGNLYTILDRTLAAAPMVDVLIADDASPDGTGVLADQYAAREPRVRVLHREKKEGLGPAYLAGFAWAIEVGYKKFFEMDADGSHPPEKLPEMVALLDTHDMVIGSRWMRGGKVVNWPLRREILSRGGNLYTRFMLGIKVKDATGGFRGFTKHALDEIDLSTVASQGYNFQVDLLWHALRVGLNVIEVPIVFVERVIGTSKMSGGIVLEALWRVTLWGLARPFGKR